ncbi:TcaA NTF2-like domain-containing protein [Alteribacillus iranensis]|uniref:Uncharacterized protein n=1 Tax=Alteribacillus iranensis TaxID=930128 RepID=A0A1I2BPR4_9BACI|nr:hypothetical protein [Alteribacillus iranensis]SFE58102.1 hypothetical protein SAMN05192532_102437 [Alteribacillus iranensis]
MSFDANLLYVDGDQPDARVYVNGKDTGVTLANADTLGPMMKDGSVTVSAVYHSPDAGRLESNEVVLQNDDSIWLEFPEVEKKEEEPAYAEGSEPPTQEEAPAVEELPVEEAAVSFTESDVAQFTENYLHYSVEAMNVGSFDMVKHFHDPMGKTYKESSEYIDYIVEKGITEDLVYTTVHDVQNNGDSYHVVVEDAYNIFYNDGTATYKEFLSTFKVTEKNGELFIHELLELEELRSEDIH